MHRSEIIGFFTYNQNCLLFDIKNQANILSLNSLEILQLVSLGTSIRQIEFTSEKIFILGSNEMKILDLEQGKFLTTDLSLPKKNYRVFQYFKNASDQFLAISDETSFQLHLDSFNLLSSSEIPNNRQKRKFLSSGSLAPNL